MDQKRWGKGKKKAAICTTAEVDEREVRVRAQRLSEWRASRGMSPCDQRAYHVFGFDCFFLTVDSPFVARTRRDPSYPHGPLISPYLRHPFPLHSLFYSSVFKFIAPTFLSIISHSGPLLTVLDQQSFHRPSYFDAHLLLYDTSVKHSQWILLPDTPSPRPTFLARSSASLVPCFRPRNA